MGDMQAVATRQDVYDIVGAARDDIIEVLDAMLTRIDGRFVESERRIIKLQTDVSVISGQIDGLYKAMEIADDERAVLAYQLTKLHTWTERAAKRLGISYDN